MSRTIINVGAVLGLSSTITSAKTTVSSVKSSLDSTRSQIDGKVLNRNNIRNRLSNVSSRLSTIENRIFNIKNTVERGANGYYNADIRVMNMKSSLSEKINVHIGNTLDAWNTKGSGLSDKETDKVNIKGESADKFFSWTWKDTWKLTGSAGIIGSIASTVGGAITGGKSVSNGLSTIKSVAKVVENIAKAVPKTSKSTFDWKTLFGFNPAITKDTPKTFGKAFGESIDKLKFGNAKTVSDKVAVGAKWAGYGFTAITTIYDNFTDDEENNSTGRKIAESVGETVVKVGEGLLLGAGVTAAFAAAGVAAPAVVVGAVTVGVTWAVDKVCEAVTGKDVAEFVSDTVLDFTGKVGNVVGNTAKKVSGAVSGWWKKAFG